MSALQLKALRRQRVQIALYFDEFHHSSAAGLLREGEPAALEVGAAAMGRRKGEDTTAAKRRRMPFVAKIQWSS
jgi:hypothetical protein